MVPVPFQRDDEKPRGLDVVSVIFPGNIQHHTTAWCQSFEVTAL